VIIEYPGEIGKDLELPAIQVSAALAEIECDDFGHGELLGAKYKRPRRSTLR
jgi:hypothetical protein